MQDFLKEKLEQAIKERQLTVASFERLAGLKRNTIQSILRGIIRNPSVKTLQAIAYALNWKLSDLVQDKYHHDNDTQQSIFAEQDYSILDISLLESKDLFRETLTFITNYIFQHSSQIKLNEFIEITLSIFNYCKRKNKSKLDVSFAKLILNKYFEKVDQRMQNK